VRAELNGFAPVQRVIEVVGGEPQRVELNFVPSLSVDDKGSRGTSPALWTGIATGVLGLGAGGMALWAASEQTKYDDALAGETSRRELDTLADSTQQKALITDVLLGATVVAGVITLVLIVTDGPEERPRTSSIVIGPGAVRAAF
jgi:hypothetical protein